MYLMELYNVYDWWCFCRWCDCMYLKLHTHRVHAVRLSFDTHAHIVSCTVSSSTNEHTGQDRHGQCSGMLSIKIIPWIFFVYFVDNFLMIQLSFMLVRSLLICSLNCCSRLSDIHKHWNKSNRSGERMKRLTVDRAVAGETERHTKVPIDICCDVYTMHTLFTNRAIIFVCRSQYVWLCNIIEYAHGDAFCCFYCWMILKSRHYTVLPYVLGPVQQTMRRFRKTIFTDTLAHSTTRIRSNLNSQQSKYKHLKCPPYVR